MTEDQENKIKGTLGPIKWTNTPLKENPIRAPMEELRAHKLCMSGASEEWIPLCCATHASTVTSAIATPALPAVKDRSANTICSFSWNDKKNIDRIPMIPDKICNI